MAWPCISRVCCLARFWNQFDKSDLSVPLATHNYSELAEPEVRTVAKLLPEEPRSRPRQEHQPFPGVTQYKQDYQPWPVPRRDNFPWIRSGGADGQERAGRRRDPVLGSDRAEQQSQSSTRRSTPLETSYQAAFSPDPHHSSIRTAQEQTVKTRQPPNPSAVFQSKSRIFNI